MARYTNEFKATIIELFNGGKSLSELSREYDVSKSTISTWVKKAKPIATENGDLTQADFYSLLKKMKQLEEENEIFKKAMVIFTKD